jgi:phosphoenolpyruvate-protein phosphotransferase
VSAGIRVIPARPASEGVVVGPAVVLAVAAVPDDLPTDATFSEVARETADRLDGLAARVRAEGRADEADVLEAYALMAGDPALVRDVEVRTAAGTPLVAAIRAAVAQVEATFRAMDDEYFRQRADDVAGVGRELVATVAGTTSGDLAHPDGAIICAEDLTPADTVRLDLARIGGIATEQGGPTSHTAIVARAAGIPAVVGAAGLLAAIAAASTSGAASGGGAVELLVDGDRGEVVVGPDAGTVAEVASRLTAAQEVAEAQRTYRGRPVAFAGRRVLVAANVGGRSDIAAAVASVADGVGLFRSEFLFLERSDVPDLGEQIDAYRAAVQAFDDPTVVRTLDIGGDKDVAYLDLPREDNPFLGVRGLRLCLAHPELFDVQLDALIAVGEPERLRIMLPMVSSLADLEAGAARLADRARIAGVAPPPLGIMVETPAAALLAPQLARHAAFFSIGTNDLTQYVTAADRTNGALGAYQDAANPAVLQLVDRTCRAAADAGIHVAVCGEAASDPAVAAVLLGLGVTELSVAPTRIDRVRWLVDQLDADRVRAVAAEILSLPDADAVRETVAPLLP